MDTQVLIIGGGCTGTGLARDLALRGISCVLVEQGDINAGASGGNHGLLHSGARYVSNDPHSASECQAEAELLKELAPHCIEDTGGLFVAVEGDDERYTADFQAYCDKAGIWCQSLDIREAAELEPRLSERLLAAYAVRDATLDPFQVSLENIGQALERGSQFLKGHQVIGFQTRAGRVRAVLVRNVANAQQFRIQADVVVNASGAWAGQIAALAGIPLEMLYSKGTLLVAHKRLTSRVINRLRPPSDGDILVPGGTVSIMGTTSVQLSDLSDIRPTRQEARAMVEQGAAMLPELLEARFTRAYAGVRPLLKSDTADGRAVSRGFALMDHVRDGLENLLTVTSGKLTTYRLMAEKAADLTAQKLGLDTVCRTRTEPLPDTQLGRWTEGGRSSKAWLSSGESTDHILCECEMVPTSHCVQVLDDLQSRQAEPPDLDQLRRRTRLGKGSCQGSFCSVRVTGVRYEQGTLQGRQGRRQVKDFLQARWAGQLPVLWGAQLAQAELSEGIHCALFGLEMEQDS